jgi:hypothetical protein
MSVYVKSQLYSNWIFSAFSLSLFFSFCKLALTPSCLPRGSHGSLDVFWTTWCFVVRRQPRFALTLSQEPFFPASTSN